MPLKATENDLVLPLLGVLVEAPRHQYALARLLRRRYPSLNIRAGTIYTLVASLTAEGWVTPLRQERSGNRPPRSLYSLTERGWAEFRARVERQLRDATLRPASFAIALAYLASLPAATAAKALQARVELLEREAGRLEAAEADAQSQGVQEIHMIEVSFARSQLNQEVDWIRALIGRIEDGTLEWPMAPAHQAEASE